MFLFKIEFIRHPIPGLFMIDKMRQNLRQKNSSILAKSFWMFLSNYSVRWDFYANLFE